MNNQYISNNKELVDVVTKFYLQEVPAITVANLYFKYNLYSAASTYYNIYLQEIRNKTYIDNYNMVKSYCFCQMARCYYYQQKDGNYSNWQLEMIHNLCKDSLVYNKENTYTYIILGSVYFLQNKDKEAYYEFKNAIMCVETLEQYTLDNRFYEEMLNIILLMFDICKDNHILLTDEIIKKIYKFLSEHTYYTHEHIQLVNDRISKHYDLLDIEVNIMNGTF